MFVSPERGGEPRSCGGTVPLMPSIRKNPIHADRAELSVSVPFAKIDMPHPCGSGYTTTKRLNNRYERAPSVRIGLFVLRTSVMRSALCIYVYLLFL